jgi:hypothetical protein
MCNKQSYTRAVEDKEVIWGPSCAIRSHNQTLLLLSSRQGLYNPRTKRNISLGLVLKNYAIEMFVKIVNRRLKR